MKTITKRILLDTLKPSLLSLFILMSIIWLMQSLRFMDLLINKGLDVKTFIWIIALVMPSMLLVVLPISLFSGTVYAFKRLHDDNELSPIFSTGQSKWRVVKPTLYVSMGVVVLCYFISLFFMPAGMRTFKALQHELRQNVGTLLIEEGQFNQVDDKTMVFVRKKEGESTLKGILVHIQGETEKTPASTWMAEEGRISIDAKGYPKLTLIKGTHQQLEQNALSVLEFQSYTLDVMQQISLKKERKPGPQELYMGELLNFNGASQNRIYEMKAEFHKRLLWPLSPLPMTLIAAAFLVRYKRNRYGVGKIVGYTSFTVLLYQTLLMTLNSLSHEGNALVLYSQWCLPFLTSLICWAVLTDWHKTKGRLNDSL